MPDAAPPAEFASWVAPIAERDRAAREELLRFVRSVPDERWHARIDDAWSAKDVLAHLAGDTGKWFAKLIGTALGGEVLDPRSFDVHAINARDVQARRDRSILELIDEIERDSESHLAMLSRLRDEHQSMLMASYGNTFGAFLSNDPAGNRGQHDLAHLAQLRDLADSR